MPHERARKIQTEIFRGLQSLGQTKAAECLGVSEGTISKMKAEDAQGETKITFPKLSRLLALMKLKVVPEHYQCVDPETFRILHRGHQLWAESIKNPDQLLFDDPE